MPIEIAQPKIIICEGVSDVAFFEELFAVRQLAGFQALSANGKGGFRDSLIALSGATGFATLSGVLLVGDCDVDPAGGFINIRDQISEAGVCGTPVRPANTVTQPGAPAVAVLMLPWLDRMGCLETLLVEAARLENPEVARCVDEYATCSGANGWNESELPKMKLQSVISAICRSDPVTALRYLWKRPEVVAPLRSACFDQVTDYLRRFP